MKSIFSIFFSDFVEVDEENNKNTSVRSSPPRNHHQRFESICKQVEEGKPNFDSLDLTSQYVALTRFSRTLACCKKLKHLKMEGTMLSKTSEEISAFFRQGIQRNESLVSLDLSGNPLFTDGVLLINQSLRVHPTLRKLKLGSCHLGDEGIKNLGRLGLRLKELDISNNKISNMSSLSKLLSENQFMTTLEVSDHSIASDKNNNQVESPILSIKRSPCLESLDLSMRRLRGQISMNILCSVLPIFDLLCYLNLSGNNFGNDGFSESVATFATCLVNIQKVNLENCNITPAAVIRLAGSLQDNNAASTLRDLSLAYNSIGDAGVQALVQCHSSIQFLDVTGTKFTGNNISNALAGNKNLYQLVYNRNVLKQTTREEIAFWTRLNASGRRRLVSDGAQENGFHGLWQHILEGSNDSPSITYYLLRQKPEIYLQNYRNLDS